MECFRSLFLFRSDHGEAMKTRLSLLLFLIFLVPQIARARLIQAGNVSVPVSVYESSHVGTSFTVIGKVTVTAPLASGLVDEIKAAAARNGGDAVLLYKVVRQGGLPSVGTSTFSQTHLLQVGDATQKEIATGTGIQVGEQMYPMAEGIVIKFSKDGIREITQETVIPVLQ